MNVEARMIAILQAQAGLAGVLIRYGYIPQEDEKKPPALPYMVLERIGSEWLETICGVYRHACFVDVALVTYEKDAQAARSLAQIAGDALCASDEQPSLTNEVDNFDAEARAWSVTQTFRVWDDAPSV